MDELRERWHLLQPACSHPTPALFVDRDGVQIEDKHHLSVPEKVVLCQGSQTLVTTANKKCWPVVVLTNQSGIARGYFDWDSYERATNQLLQLLGPSAPVAGIDANGHGPDAPEDNWCKPSPAMPLEPAQDLNLDLKRSILVSDRCSDLDAGARAGVQTLVYVLKGHSREERPLLTARGQHEWLRVLEPQPAELLLLNSLLDFPAALLSQNR